MFDQDASQIIENLLESQMGHRSSAVPVSMTTQVSTLMVCLTRGIPMRSASSMPALNSAPGSNPTPFKRLYMPAPSHFCHASGYRCSSVMNRTFDLKWSLCGKSQDEGLAVLAASLLVGMLSQVDAMHLKGQPSPERLADLLRSQDLKIRPVKPERMPFAYHGGLNAGQAARLLNLNDVSGADCASGARSDLLIICATVQM